MSARRPTLWKAALAAVVLGACAASATAQAVRPPTPRKADDPPYVWNIFILLVIAGTVFGVNMIPSKRGHQD